ncbi:MAG TPA: putative sugar nucleotidyl transferase [bacterium]|nr:putative sugar nucleotidyl transferase [bacterium]
MKTCIFEDSKWVNLTPLSYLRPVFHLRCGYHTLIERILPRLPGTKASFYVRDYLAPLVKKNFSFPVNEPETFENDVLLINGRWLLTGEAPLDTTREAAHVSGDSLVYALVRRETIRKLWKGSLEQLLNEIPAAVPRVPLQANLIEYPWQLIHHNPTVLREDFTATGLRGLQGKFASQSVIYGPPDLVYLAPGAEVHPLVVLDTNSGPIFIEEKVKIYPGARIEGPCYLGAKTEIMPGASIREGNSFGPVCKVGGEVEESIFHGYTNKYHDGFIGHSYVGEFVNLGALTTNSDLKNDYSTVSVPVNGTLVDTGELKVGSFFGDHTKTSIGTFFNTGSSVGIMCNITAGGILPKFFPSFVWYVNNKFMKGFGLEMMLETARSAMARRKRELSPEEEAVIRTVYELTREQRQAAIRKSRKT